MKNLLEQLYLVGYIMHSMTFFLSEAKNLKFFAHSFMDEMYKNKIYR